MALSQGACVNGVGHTRLPPTRVQAMIFQDLIKAGQLTVVWGPGVDVETDKMTAVHPHIVVDAPSITRHGGCRMTSISMNGTEIPFSNSDSTEIPVFVIHVNNHHKLYDLMISEMKDRIGATMACIFNFGDIRPPIDSTFITETGRPITGVCDVCNHKVDERALFNGTFIGCMC